MSKINGPLQVSSQRAHKYDLNHSQIDKLESLDGWVWDILEWQWNEGFKHLGDFVKKEGHARPPAKYKCNDGFKLGLWVFRQRQNKEKLTNNKIEKLEVLDGWAWDVLEWQWNDSFKHIINFSEDKGHVKVPDKYKDKTGFSLGKWVYRQRKNKDKLTQEKIDKLNSIGFIWKL